MATYIEQSLAKLEEFEGSIPWMYRDTVGRVTVGVGLMLTNATAAEGLPFVLEDRPATRAEIQAEFARVDGLPKGQAAHCYRRDSGPELEKAEIDAALRRILLGFEDRLREVLHGYDAMPDPVKMALLDMAYNLGPEGLVRGYPKLIRATESGAWAQAAACSFRHGPSAARNEWTRQMFLENVAGAIKAEAEGRLLRLVYGLVGLLASLWPKLE